MNLATDLTSGILMLAVVAVADSQVDPLNTTAALLEKFGIMAVVLAYFIVRDYFRSKDDKEEKLALIAKIDESQRYVRETLTQQLSHCTNVIRDNLKTHDRFLKAIETTDPLKQAAHDRRIERAEDPELNGTSALEKKKPT